MKQSEVVYVYGMLLLIMYYYMIEDWEKYQTKPSTGFKAMHYGGVAALVFYSLSHL